MTKFEENFPGLHNQGWQILGQVMPFTRVMDNDCKEMVQRHCIDKKVAEEEIRKWIANLRTGDGDYKKVYTHNSMDLLLKLGIGNQAHQDLKDGLESTPVQIETFKKDTSNETSEGEIPKQN